MKTVSFTLYFCWMMDAHAPHIIPVQELYYIEVAERQIGKA